MTLSKPLGKEAACLAQAGVASTLQHHLHGAAYRHRADGGWLGVQWPRLTPPAWLHPATRLSWEGRLAADLRQLWGVRSGASPLIRAQAGSSLKTALSHTLRCVHLDDELLPTRGYALRCHQELAMAPGSVQHVRTELHAQYHLPLYRQLAVSLQTRLGHLLPLMPLSSSSSSSSSSLVDRFRMGGPQSVRGYGLHSLGPQTPQGDALGGNVLAEAGLHVTMPLSASTAPFLRAHGWVNGGLLLDDPPLTVAAMKPVCSAGLGIAVKLGEAARLELNLCQPLFPAEPFSLRSFLLGRGLQLGLGLEFI